MFTQNDKDQTHFVIKQLHPLFAAVSHCLWIVAVGQNCSQTWAASCINWTKMSLSSLSTHLLFCSALCIPLDQVIHHSHSKNSLPYIHITPQNVDHNTEAGSNTRTLFGQRQPACFPPPPHPPFVTWLGRRWGHILGMSSWPPQQAGSRVTHLSAGRVEVFFRAVAWIPSCTHTSSFKAHSQICGRGVTAPPGFCQAVSRQQERRWMSAYRKRNVTAETYQQQSPQPLLYLRNNCTFHTRIRAVFKGPNAFHIFI